MKSKYLITGGCGFVGSNLSSEAINRGYEVVVFDNLSRFGSSRNLEWLRRRGAFDFVHGDIRNPDDVETLIKRFRPDVVFHLAGQVAMTTSLDRPYLDFQTNVIGTLNVLEAVRKHVPDAAILYSSSNKVYGDLEQYAYGETKTRYVCNEFPNGFPESVPLNFTTPYGCSKGAADQYLLDYHRMYGLKTVVFRHSSMYGGRQFATYDQGWVGWFVSQALAVQNDPKHEFTVSGNGKQVRDLLHGEDVVALYFDASDQIDDAVGRAFNIGGGIDNSSSIVELLETMSDILGIELKFNQKIKRKSDQKVFIADLSSIHEVIGWIPKISKRIGVERAIAWSKEVESLNW